MKVSYCVCFLLVVRGSYGRPQQQQQIPKNTIEATSFAGLDKAGGQQQQQPEGRANFGATNNPANTKWSPELNPNTVWTPITNLYQTADGNYAPNYLYPQNRQDKQVNPNARSWDSRESTGNYPGGYYPNNNNNRWPYPPPTYPTTQYPYGNNNNNNNRWPTYPGNNQRPYPGTNQPYPGNGNPQQPYPGGNPNQLYPGNNNNNQRPFYPSTYPGSNPYNPYTYPGGNRYPIGPNPWNNNNNNRYPPYGNQNGQWPQGYNNQYPNQQFTPTNSDANNQDNSPWSIVGNKQSPPNYNTPSTFNPQYPNRNNQLVTSQINVVESVEDQDWYQPGLVPRIAPTKGAQDKGNQKTATNTISNPKPVVPKPN